MHAKCRPKPVTVVYCDTGVDIPVVRQLVDRSLDSLQEEARKYWTCVGSVDCFRLRTVRGKESVATNEPGLPTGVSPRSHPAG
jgi:3'-phosphoadenosine 5'-phosphosulfate sulfotransferase (PAPS reductase)/FAD synthetase